VGFGTVIAGGVAHRLRVAHNEYLHDFLPLKIECRDEVVELPYLYLFYQILPVSL
jgi:hypothetical protein